jgi:two-component system cell cycle response regulator DivK
VNKAVDARKTILVVDDVPMILSAVTDVLEHVGYAVVSGRNGMEGLRLARDCRPDVILLDLALPKSSGVDVLDSLKGSAETRDIPVILMTAYAHLLSGSDARLAAGVIQKPFNVSELLTLVEQVLSGDRGQESLAGGAP